MGAARAQVSRLLLAAGPFGSRQLSVTWVECQPGSQQALHAHPAQEQVYVMVQGRSQMLAGGRSVRGLPWHAGVRAAAHPTSDPDHPGPAPRRAPAGPCGGGLTGCEVTTTGSAWALPDVGP